MNIRMAWVISLGISGCGASEMAQEWQLDRLRILGVRATPAEPQPGDTVTFESLVYVPPDVTVTGVVWFGCLPDGGVGFGCPIDPDLFEDLSSADPATADPAELAAQFAALQEAGLLGFEPFLPPTYAVPIDALDTLDESARQEGRNAIINLTALPEGAEADDIELAYKRLPVSEAVTPNHNPDIEGIVASGADLRGGTGTEGDPFRVRPKGKLTFTPELAEDAVETYQYRTSTGETEDRTEEPYFSWYLEDGTFDQNISLPPFSETEYTAPKEAGWSGVVMAVVRDRRGGMGWSQVWVAVE